ncbi:hypothetical protein D3C80_1762130 [compost metagenome]
MLLRQRVHAQFHGTGSLSDRRHLHTDSTLLLLREGLAQGVHPPLNGIGSLRNRCDVQPETLLLFSGKHLSKRVQTDDLILMQLGLNLNPLLLLLHAQQDFLILPIELFVGHRQ